VSCLLTIPWLLAQVPRDSWVDKIPGLQELLLLLAAIGLAAVMVWFIRGSHTANGFVIHVDEHDVTFRGQFPPQAQATIIEFLRDDVALPGTYEIRGRWDGQLLAIIVKGDQAHPYEQRIRNFLKITLKPPRPL
jgi:hypothetical protein